MERSDGRRDGALTQEDYQSLHPTYCHECSLKQVEVERRKAKNPVFKEALEQAEQGIKHAHSDEVKIAKLHEAMGRFVVEAYIDMAKRIGKNLTGEDIGEPRAIELAKKLLEEDQKQRINPWTRIFLGGAATPDTEDYKERDGQGRIILELVGDTVYETRYNDSPDAKYEKSMSYWNLADKRTNKYRPDLVAWAESVRKKAKNTDNNQKEDVHDQSD